MGGEFRLFCKKQYAENYLTKSFNYKLKCYTFVILNITDMEAITNRKQTAFRLSPDLLSRLKQAATKQNRSLNNFVENILMDTVYNEPNEDTKEAIKEAKSGTFAGTLDLSNLDVFVKSLNEIK